MTNQIIRNEWLENMEEVRFRWNTTYLDMIHWGDNFMPLEMGFIYWALGKPDPQLPYAKRGYCFKENGEIYKTV